jgi:hypothetical protein
MNPVVLLGPLGNAGFSAAVSFLIQQRGYEGYLVPL